MSRIKVRRKVLIPLSLTFVVLIIAFVWACNGIRRMDERQMLQHRFWSAQNVLDGVLKENAAVLTSTAEFIASQQTFRRAITHHDINTLLEFSKPLLGRLSKQLEITHFYYFDPQGELLLRVYFPEDASRSAPRKNLQQAMKSGKAVVGLEIGQHGTFAQRLVLPWYQAGQLIGYIELGTDLKNILMKVQHITETEFVVAVRKEHVSFQKWLDFSSTHPAPFSWDLLAEKLITNTTLQVSRELIKNVFSRSEYGTVAEELVVGKRVFRGALLPQNNREGLQVGEMVMLVDVTEEKVAFYSFLWWVIGFSVLLSGALFVFAYRTLGRVGHQLTAGEDRLLLESANLEQANIRLLEEIDTRTQAEADLRSLNQTLEQRVSERTVELVQKNALLAQNRLALEKTYCELKEKQAAILHQDKMACIGQLAAGIAHDINNPVGFISHNLTLFARYYLRLVQFFSLQEERNRTSEIPEIRVSWEKDCRDLKVAEVFEEIPVMLEECQDGTKRITQIVQGLRTFIRSETPHHELTDLHHCLDSSLLLLRHEVRDKIRVIKEYQPIPLRYCYSQQMNQVFMNLLINACQAISESGEIRIRTWTDNQQICIAISDTGCGIPPETLSKIYEPFYTTKAIGVGTGLGLSIVYDVVERHSGSLTVASEVGLGTTFTIMLPFDDRHVLRNSAVVDSNTTVPGEQHD